MSSGTAVVAVSAVVIRDDAGRVLLVRKRGTDGFMLPGGKPELGETAARCAARELLEEVQVEVAPVSLRLIGTFRAAAVNEPDDLIDATVFEAPSGEVRGPGAEIEELRWWTVGPTGDRTRSVPLLLDQLVPVLTEPTPGID